jgi:hypothetical protein
VSNSLPPDIDSKQLDPFASREANRASSTGDEENEAVYLRWENGAGEEMGEMGEKAEEERRRGERWRFLVYLLLTSNTS